MHLLKFVLIAGYFNGVVYDWTDDMDSCELIGPFTGRLHCPIGILLGIQHCDSQRCIPIEQKPSEGVIGIFWFNEVVLFSVGHQSRTVQQHPGP